LHRACDDFVGFHEPGYLHASIRIRCQAINADMSTGAGQTHAMHCGNTVKASGGWFDALGAGTMIAGFLAGPNLFAPLASIAVIAAMMLVAAAMQIIHAIAQIGWKRGTLNLIGGAFYAAASLVILYDPVFSDFCISLITGSLLIDAGITRVAIGIRDRTDRRSGWIAAGGVATILVGLLVLSTWPGLGLWLLGCLLTLDILFQGLCFFEFGVAQLQD